uniref:Tetratricopeptide repeat protein 18 n=1 Tax=Stomoxys calcitrans TaxID=35570 RepID=A0A1I8PHY7_STOCA
MGRSSRKQSAKSSDGGGDQPTPTATGTATRIFLYLKAKAIEYPIGEDVSVEIELIHPNVITKLCDHYTPDNVILLDEFNVEKPTFSITINQNDIEVCQTPLSLVLYENVIESFCRDNESGTGVSINSRDIKDFETPTDEVEEEELLVIHRNAVAMGYIDLLEFFTKTRCHSQCTVFLYPLPSSSHHISSKMEWEIYSLHPLIKQANFSNVAFITLTSIYNVEDLLMNDCEDLTARLSFVANTPNEMGQYEKIPLCQFTGFTKQVIADQSLDLKWETLKNKKIGNEQSMGVNTQTKVNKQKLFRNLLFTENVDFNIADIDAAFDMALICNSLHRYILTYDMEKALEEVLALNRYRMVVEIIQERDPTVVLLQGYLDLSVMMYPQVSNCSFAIELRPPEYKKPTLTPTTHKDRTTPKQKMSKKGKRTDSITTVETTTRTTTSTLKEKFPFAIIQICLDKPITDPIQDIIEVAKPSLYHRQLFKCPRKQRQKKYALETPMEIIREDSYREFEDTILGMVLYILQNNIQSAHEDKQFYCSQLGNISNRILRLVACDFNRRQQTNTNLEFTKLMTLVYKELSQRVYDIVMKYNFPDSGNGISAEQQLQSTIISHINIAKYQFELGNLEMGNYVIAKLQEQYSDNVMLKFYMFLYDMERQNFEAAKLYLDKPYREKYSEALVYINIIDLYITYKQQQSDSEQVNSAKENLLHSLSQHCEANFQDISTWILLYCLYKQNKYFPGMEYCRWNFENLLNNVCWVMPAMPQSRWDMYMPHKIEFKSKRSQNFYIVTNLFLKLGLYEFAQWIFDEISPEAMELEKYFINNTFKILMNKLEKKFNIKNFPTEKFLNSKQMSATLSQVNGNLEYARNALSESAMKYYSQICEIESLETYELYNLGILRYAYHLMAAKEYAKAKDVFSLCCYSTKGIGIVAAIGKGKACYRLNDLDEAEKSFAQATHCDMYLPNIWAYLGLVNLRKGENYQALECWKYARLNPKEEIHAEILHELKSINYENIDLFVDAPDFRMECTMKH